MYKVCSPVIGHTGWFLLPSDTSSAKYDFSAARFMSGFAVNNKRNVQKVRKMQTLAEQCQKQD